MLRSLRQPKWIAAGVAVGLLASIFVYLGLWQLDRHSQRLTENATREERLSIPATSLPDLLADVDGDLSRIEFRRASVEGVYVTGEEVLIRSQVHMGTAGFHVITPYQYGAGAVLVNRGWVPLLWDQPPVEQAPPSNGPIEGWVHLTQTRGFLGPVDEPGDRDVLSRVDIERIQGQVSVDLDPVYLVLIAEDNGLLPAPNDLPQFTDQGPHLAYAIQWFGFALVGLVGFFFLLRAKGRN